MELANKKKILETLESFKNISQDTYQILAILNYKLEETLKIGEGKWEIYTKRNFVFPYFLQITSTPVNKFVAIYNGEKKFIIYGSFENYSELKEELKKFTSEFLRKGKEFFGIPLYLTPQNAQDYGYIRGLLAGIFLIFADLIYSWCFKLKNGILTGFIEYIKLVYDGNPNLGIGIGITGSGLYFGFLLIFLPILYGNICVKRVRKIQEKKLKNLPDSFGDYEYGFRAEQSLREEYTSILEEIRKRNIYNEVIETFPQISKENFEMLYRKLNEGFFSPESLHSFIIDFQRMCKSSDIKKFIEIILKYRKTTPKVEIKFK